MMAHPADITSTRFNYFQIFTAFIEGSSGSFLGLIVLQIVIFSQFNDFNEPESTVVIDILSHLGVLKTHLNSFYICVETKGCQYPIFVVFVMIAKRH